ncbi:MAG: hypothetical protein Q4A90_04885 [Streptococcus sp.]|nr:hypothetical protein [Streptococcus sp.]
MSRKHKIILLILSGIFLVSVYLFFKITEGWLFWLDTVVVILSFYWIRKILLENNTKN